MKYAAARKQFIEYWSSEEQGKAVAGRDALLYALACMSAGKAPQEKHILDALGPIYYRTDCSDFSLMFLLRMLNLNQTNGLLSEQVVQKVKKVLLDYDYWFSENAKFMGKQNMWTENHVMAYHSGEYLICQLFQDEVFRARGKTGREIMAELKPKIVHWIQLKAKVGFSEWDSHNYFATNANSMLNLFDFAEDEELKNLASGLLNVMLFGMAVNSFRGAYSCSYGRSYYKGLKSASGDPSRSIKYVLWNLGELSKLDFNKFAVALGTSSFEPHPVIEQILHDDAIIASYEQQSFDVEDGPLFGRGYEDEEDLTLYWQNMGYTHVNVIEQNKRMGEKYGIKVHKEIFDELEYVQDCRDRGVSPEACRSVTYLSRINKLTYRTPEYMLSCAQDYRKGQNGFQQHIWQATLGTDAIVFTSHPGTMNEGDGRPDLWAGNGIFPRAVQHKNTLICAYKLREDVAIPYSHAYFPKRGFDEVAEVSGWIFGRKDDGFVALYSQHGYEWSERPQFAEEEVICRALDNVWICQLGSVRENGSFSSFVADVLSSSLSFDGLNAEWQLGEQQYRFGWDTPFTVNGKEIPLTGYARFDNPYCHSPYRSGSYEIRYGDEVLKLQFGEAMTQP